MRLSQEHIFAQAINDAHSILVDWDNGVITAQDAYNDIIKLKDAGAGYKTVPRHDFHNPHPFGSRFNDPLERKLVDYLTGQDIVMADPLPHPSEDKPQRPNPNQEPSSPYLPGKSPVPSRDDKLASERINPDTILLPFIPKEPTTDDSYGDPHGTPEEIDELMKKGWAGVRPGMMGIPGSEEEDTKFPMPIIEEDFPGDPGIGPDSIPTPTEQYYDPIQTIAELNPAQIEALKKIPANIKDLPDAERLQRMREITDEVKGLA